MELMAREIVDTEADPIGGVSTEADGLALPDVEWGDFVAEMEAGVPDELDSDESKIDWLLGKLRKIRGTIEENEGIAKCGIRLQEDWLAGENAKLERTATHFRRWIAILMPSSAEEARKAYGKLSRSLPNGDVGFKKDKDTIAIDDATAAVNYAIGHALHVNKKTTRSVSVATLKAHMEATGVLEGDGWRHVEGLSHVFVTPAK